MPCKDRTARSDYQREYQLRTDHAGQEREKYQTDPMIRERQSNYRKENLDRYAALQRGWRAINPHGTMIINARVRAKKGGYPCTITVVDLTWPTHCPIFGIELDYNKTPTGKRKHAPRDAFPTLDKKRPELGYVPGNVFVISYKANRLKQDSSIEQLEALLQYMKA